MTTMITEIYDALRSIGTDEPKARAAAEALSASVNVDLGALRTDVSAVKTDIAVVKSELQFHRWAFAIVIAMQVAILGRLLLHP